MKRFILLFLFLIIILPTSDAKIISGEVEYNAENVRNELFSEQISPLDVSTYRKHLIDDNNIENLNYLYQGITELKDRKIAKFSDGSYGIQYYDDPIYSWYYSSNGRLINFTKKDSVSYPCKITKYKPNGSIANQGYRISAKESYIYTPEGKLIAHWLGENCYDENNNLIMKRKVLK